MKTDTAHPRFIPARPDLPVNGLPFPTWANKNRRQISAYFYDLDERYLESEEWELRAKALYTVQQTSEEL